MRDRRLSLSLSLSHRRSRCLKPDAATSVFLSVFGRIAAPSSNDAAPRNNKTRISSFHMYNIQVSISYLLTHLLTPCSTVLLDKLSGFQLVKKFPAFYGTRRFIPHSQVPATCFYPEPARSIPYPHIPLPADPS
jgi:hypothetical protein